MDLKPLFHTIFKTFNPYSYVELDERKFRSALKYLLFVIICSIIVMFILFIPFFFNAHNYITQDAAHFENLTIASAFVLKEPFDILSSPLIRVDMQQQNMTNEFLLITPDTVSHRQYLVLGRQVDKPLIKSVDLASSENARMLVGLAVIFVVPSLFFWSIILFTIYFSIIIFLTFILGLIITGSFRMDIRARSVLKAAMYSCTIFIILQLVLMPFFRLFWIPLILYWLLFFIVLFSRQIQSKDKEKTKGAGSSKTGDIFSHKSSGSSGQKNKADLRDQYDVDENGNLKGSGWKKRFDEGNDGYVEL